jgi:glycolate oxidase
MSVSTWQKIQDRFEKGATTDPFERGFYDRDLAPVPNFLANLVARTLPDIVVRPQTVEEVSELLKIAAADRVPVTARAGGASVYFNCVCLKNGIIADLNGLKGVLNVNKAAQTVRVGAGTTWVELERAVANQGFTTLSYPSSAPAATVGGWLAMGGYGLGSVKNGPLVDQVRAVQVVLPDGRIEELTAATAIPVAWLAGAEGTLGLATEIELKVRPLREQWFHGLAECKDAISVQQFIEAAVKLTDRPFNLHFSDPACNAVRYRLGMASEQASQAFTVAFDIDGSTSELSQATTNYRDCLSQAKAQDMSEEAVEEWEHRYFSLVLKREAPSLLGAEIWLPINQLAVYLRDISTMESSKQLGLKSYGHVATATHIMVMTMFNSDERDIFGYLQGLALVKKLHDIGARYGGYPYGTGLWNTPYLNRIYPAEQLTELRRRKALLDPDNIMNPGKLYRTPRLLSPALFNLGMDVLAATTTIYRGRNHV